MKRSVFLLFGITLLSSLENESGCMTPKEINLAVNDRLSFVDACAVNEIGIDFIDSSNYSAPVTSILINVLGALPKCGTDLSLDEEEYAYNVISLFYNGILIPIQHEGKKLYWTTKEVFDNYLSQLESDSRGSEDSRSRKKQLVESIFTTIQKVLTNGRVTSDDLVQLQNNASTLAKEHDFRFKYFHPLADFSLTAKFVSTFQDIFTKFRNLKNSTTLSRERLLEWFKDILLSTEYNDLFYRTAGINEKSQGRRELNRAIVYQKIEDPTEQKVEDLIYEILDLLGRDLDDGVKKISDNSVNMVRLLCYFLCSKDNIELKPSTFFNMFFELSVPFKIDNKFEPKWKKRTDGQGCLLI